MAQVLLARAFFAIVVCSSVWGCGTEFTSANAGADASGVSATSNLPRRGLLLWLRSDRGVTNTDGYVSLWADQSGHNFDATQDDPNFRPTQVVGGIAGHPAVHFDGSDDFLNLPTLTADFAAGLTIFAVVNEQTPASYNSIVEFSNGSETDDIDFGEYQDNLAYEVADNSTTGNSLTYGVAQLVGVVHRADTTLVLRSNGQNAGAAQFALPDSTAREQNFVGKSLYGDSATFPGLLAELLVYGRALNEVEVQAVETELKGRWGF